jgi:serine/threonine protein phosphatase PrpC
MRASLWGEDHEELDRIASATAGDRAAVAITRGRYRKSYGYEDPNEDVAAVVVGPRATLVVCADAHYGLSASHVAVQSVLDAFGDDPPQALDDRQWLEVFAAAGEDIRHARERDNGQRASETVLIAALVTPFEVSFAAIGDSALVLCRPGTERGRQLNREAMRFLGSPMNKRSMRSTIQRGTVARDPDEWVVAVTDGLSEFVTPMRPADVVPRVLAMSKAGTAEAAAVALVETACSAGAGDNVAVALTAP